jgi:hypothetical protein
MADDGDVPSAPDRPPLVWPSPSSERTSRANALEGVATSLLVVIVIAAIAVLALVLWIWSRLEGMDFSNF